METKIELTREQRHNCYKYAYNRFIDIKKNNNIGFLCLEVEDGLSLIYDINIPDFEPTATFFPELLSFKPPSKEMGENWWDAKDIDIRIDTLLECMTLTKDENETQSR